MSNKELIKIGDKALNNNDSIVLLTTFSQKSKNNLVQNALQDNSIQIVAAPNKYTSENKYTTTLDPTLISPIRSGAGIFVNEAISPSYVFNPKREEKGLVLNQAVTRDPKTINETEKNVSTVTVFGDHIQMVSWHNGIALHTSPQGNVGFRGLGGENGISAGNGLGVSLIHGNKVEYDRNNSKDGLQSMVKGEDLKHFINQMQQRTTEIGSQILSLRTQLQILATVFGAHIHIAPQAPVGALPTIPSIEAIVTVALETPRNIKGAIDSVITQINNTLIEINQTKAFEGNFLSDFHKLN